MCALVSDCPPDNRIEFFKSVTGPKKREPNGSLFFGPSDKIRTCGILLPKQARYQLRYTRKSVPGAKIPEYYTR